jgi:hypothetical protein
MLLAGAPVAPPARLSESGRECESVHKCPLRRAEKQQNVRVLIMGNVHIRRVLPARDVAVVVANQHRRVEHA